MGTRGVSSPLIVIVGPTASGKTALAIDVAKKYNGEVICADSRTVFRDMNIGTAKPTVAERQGISHWGLDLVQPGERYTAAAWQAYAREHIAAIRSRGQVPIIVGGTGLYIDGLIFDYEYPAEPSAEQRTVFEKMSVEDLYAYCLDNNIALPENDKNKRHLVRSALSAGKPNKRRNRLIDDTIVVGITTGSEQLRERIAIRIEHMFTDGVVEEAKSLGKKYGWNKGDIVDSVYPMIREHVEGRVSLGDVKQVFRHRDWQLAKRQMTWFRRNPYIAWGRPDDCEHHIANHLSLNE